MRKKLKLLIALLFICTISFAQKEAEDLPETLKSQLSRTEAMFPGGHEKMKRFIDKQKRYASKNDKQYKVGVVAIGFIVEKDGRLDSIKVIQPLSDYYNKEAIRIVGTMPRWKPATQNGEPVRIQFTIPIRF